MLIEIKIKKADIALAWFMSCKRNWPLNSKYRWVASAPDANDTATFWGQCFGKVKCSFCLEVYQTRDCTKERDLKLKTQSVNCKEKKVPIQPLQIWS